MGRLYGCSIFGGGGTYVGKKEKGAMTPHIRYHEPHPAHIPRTQTTKSGGGEAFRFGLPGDVPKHRLPHHCSERSPHVLKAESLIMQSHQNPPWVRRTDRQSIPRLSSIVTAAIVTKTCSLLDCNDLVHTSFRSFCTRSNPFTVSRWPGSK